MATAMQDRLSRQIDPEQREAARKQLSFKHWLVTSEKAGGGLARWWNSYLLVHAAVGIGLGLAFQQDLSDRARSVVLPLAGVLVGLTFAWAATAISIVSSTEFRRIMVGSRQGVRGTANYYQLAILAVLSATVLWALAGLGPFRVPLGASAVAVVNKAIAMSLFGVTSFAVMECWSAVNLTRLTLLLYNTVKQSDDSKEP